MAKKMPFLAAIVCSIMMFPTNASAAFWLDIVKEFVAGGIKTIVMPKAAKITAAAESKSAQKSSPAHEAPKPSAQPNPEEIFAALNKLEIICMQEFVEKVPCAIGSGKNFSIGQARNEAIANARVELANNMGTYVEAQANLDDTKSEDPDGILKVTSSYIANATLKTQQFVSGAQQYLSYTYIDEEATEKNGRTVYITTVVMVMNKDLFAKALEEEGKGKSLSEQIIKESRKGIVAIVKNVIEKK